VGTGKTTLLKTVLDTFATGRISTAYVFNPRLEVLDFFEFLLTDFGIPPQRGLSLPCFYSSMAGLSSAIAPTSYAPSWSMKRRICPGNFSKRFACWTNLETSSEKLVQIVLSGQPELEEKLYHPSLRQLRQRISLWCRTQPLTSEENPGLH